MSQETKKMLSIIDKQHKEAYEQIQKENKRQRLFNKINYYILIALGMFTIVYFIIYMKEGLI